jgi:quercetin dioxygenase-like cupin family protein
LHSIEGPGWVNFYADILPQRMPAMGKFFRCRAVSELWGRSIVAKATATQTASHCSILEFTAIPGAPWSTYHTHLAAEAWYVLEGELSFRLDGQELTAPKGTFLLAPGGVPHAVANLSAEAVRYLVIFAPAGLEDWFADMARVVDQAWPAEPGPLAAVNALADRYGIVAME